MALCEAIATLKGAALDEGVNDLRQKLESNADSLPAVARSRARDSIQKFQKQIAAEKKKLLDAQISTGLLAMESRLGEAVARGDTFAVLDVKVGVDSKAVKQAVNLCKKQAPSLAVLGLSEEEPGSGGKLLCFAVVPDSQMAAGLAANDWINAALEPCGGRGGGKKDSAQGQAGSSADLASAREAAVALAASTLG